MYGVDEPRNVYTYRSLREYFTATLEKVASRLTGQLALILLLDGLDHFPPDVAAQSLSWLPDSWPKHVHVVLTTDSGDELSLRTLDKHINHIAYRRNLYNVVDECFLRIDPLDFDECYRMVKNKGYDGQRELTSVQHEVNLAELCHL